MSYRDELTPREKEVVDLLLEGLSYAEIARRLVVERCTIITHVLHIYYKLDVANRWQIMALRIKELEDEIEELRKQRT